MKTKLWFFYFLFFTCVLFSQNLDHFDIRGMEMEYLDSAFIREGKTPPFYSRPFSKQRYLHYLSETDTAVDFIPRNEGNRLPREFSFSPILGTAINFHTIHPVIDERDQYLYYRNSLEEAPLFTLGFLGEIPGWLARCEFDIRRDFFSAYAAGGYTNLPVESPWVQELDFNFPTRGYLKFGGIRAEAIIGRDRVKWGPGYRSSLTLSDTPPYYDMIGLSLFYDIFQVTFLYASLESYLTDDEYAEQLAAADTGTLNFPKDNSGQYKTLVGHRYEADIADRVQIGFTDLLMIGGRVPEFSEVTPFMFLHNIYGENYMNLNTGIDIVIVPINKVMIYSELLIEDIRSQYEKDESPPTSLGFTAGLRISTASPESFPEYLSGIWDLRIEWTRVDPWCYNRWQPYSTFSSRKKFLSPATSKNQTLDFPIGYYLGPDAESLFIETSFMKIGLLWVKLNYELRKKGEVYLDILDPQSDFVSRMNEDLAAPSGVPVISNILGLSAEYIAGPMMTLSVNTGIGKKNNSGHVEGEDSLLWELAVQCSLRYNPILH
jgi:hypothetical protein